jgi:hypothetical protein
MTDPNYDRGPVEQEERRKRHDEWLKQYEAEKASRTYLSCKHCHELIPKDLRGPGVQHCSDLCADIEEFPQVTYSRPGTKNYGSGTW